MTVIRGSWSSFFRSGKNLRNGWLVAIGLTALYMAAIRPYQNSMGIANSRGAGLAGDNSTVEPIGLWKSKGAFYQRGISRSSERAHTRGVVGGVPGGMAKTYASRAQVVASLSEAAAIHRQDADKSANDEDRKMVRTCSMELVVAKPGDTEEKIRALAARFGGFLVSSEVRGDQDISGAELTIRVPGARFEEVRAEIRKLGLRVGGEKIEAQDVTRQYVDQQANLCNLRAEENQYLAILKQAKTVKDTLDVSEKLSEVRGQIEQQQAEFEALSKQIETVSISITLRAETEARVLGLNWRPLYQMKMALRDGLDGLANYASTMASIVFFLPTVLLWLATLLAGCVIAWKLIRWIARQWFGWKAAEPMVAK